MIKIDESWKLLALMEAFVRFGAERMVEIRVCWLHCDCFRIQVNFLALITIPALVIVCKFSKAQKLKKTDLRVTKFC